MKVIILSLILSLSCIYIVEADDGLTEQQIELLKTGCSYNTVDITSNCIHELA